MTISRHGNKLSFDLHGRYNTRERGSDECREEALRLWRPVVDCHTYGYSDKDLAEN